MLGTAGGVAAAALIVVFGFRARSFEVEGNEYYSDNSVVTWIQNDDLAKNSLYILIKYNLMDPDVPAAVDHMEISLKNPWTVHVQVKEKNMIGYVDYDGAYLYFDHEGTALVRTKKVMEGVPYVEGLVFDTSAVKLEIIFRWRTTAFLRRSWKCPKGLISTALSRTGSPVQTAGSSLALEQSRFCWGLKTMTKDWLRSTPSLKSCMKNIQTRQEHCIWKTMTVHRRIFRLCRTKHRNGSAKNQKNKKNVLIICEKDFIIYLLNWIVQ